MPRGLDHSAAAFTSLVRCVEVSGSSMALLKPNDAFHGCAPLRAVLVMPHAQIQVAREVVVQPYAGDVAAGPEVELRQIRGVGVDGGRPVLHRRLGLVGQAERRGAVLVETATW